jgi:hypothetical protein
MNYWTEIGEIISFPLIKVKEGKWVSRNATLSNLKRLFIQENLKQYLDYVIIVMPESTEERVIAVKFREQGQGLICLLKWMGSNVYKDNST